MFSVNNFYNYLNQYLIDNKKDVDLKSFIVHGSRLLKDIDVSSFTINDAPYRYTGQAAMFDQEPIDLNYFNWRDYDPSSYPEGYEYSLDVFKHLSKNDFIFRHFSAVSNPILMHSELNSDEVALFEQNHFHAVHYFYHGLIARDWYRHWKHYSMKRGAESRRFGMYARDASGSREYRLELAQRLVLYKDQLHFELQEPMFKIAPQLNVHFPAAETEYDSTASATIVTEDCGKFDIQIVPETLFNTTKTHLTEKVFKPIVMKQPFIIVGCPNSLKYLRSYGFRTFEGLWDESYDSEMDPDKRMDMIMDVIQHISNLSEEDYDLLMSRVQHVVSYNRRHFFSSYFEDTIINEMHNNLNKAIKARDEEFYTMPGGTYFMYLDKLAKEGLDIGEDNRERCKVIIAHMAKTKPKVALDIIEKYSDWMDLPGLNLIR